MPASLFSAMHAAVDPRGILIRDHLAEAGQDHGRNVVAIALDRIPPAAFLDEAVQDGVIEAMKGECARMLAIYRDAGCSRRQLRAYLDGFQHGLSAAVADAMALLTLAHEGNA